MENPPFSGGFFYVYENSHVYIMKKYIYEHQRSFWYSEKDRLQQ